MPTNFLSFEISSVILKIGFTLCTINLTVNFQIEFKATITRKVNVKNNAVITHS